MTHHTLKLALHPDHKAHAASIYDDSHNLHPTPGVITYRHIVQTYPTGRFTFNQLMDTIAHAYPGATPMGIRNHVEAFVSMNRPLLRFYIDLGYDTQDTPAPTKPGHYLVWTPPNARAPGTQRSPSVRHETLDEATNAARTMAERFPTQTFYVLKAVARIDTQITVATTPVSLA